MTKKDKILVGLMTLASAIIVLGVLFLLSAAEIAPIFKFFTSMDNVLLRYIIVIVTMAVGIMTFSNACALYSNISTRKWLSIGITTFSTILTIPLVYVFVAIFFAYNGMIGPVGQVMMLDRIVGGFLAWFGNGWWIYLIFVFMLILSIVFIIVPILMCVKTVKKANVLQLKIKKL